jgi:hypothetical protein
VGIGFKPQDVVAVKGVDGRFDDFLHTRRKAQFFGVNGRHFPACRRSAATAGWGEFKLPNVKIDASFRHASAAERAAADETRAALPSVMNHSPGANGCRVSLQAHDHISGQRRDLVSQA